MRHLAKQLEIRCEGDAPSGLSRREAAKRNRCRMHLVELAREAGTKRQVFQLLKLAERDFRSK